MSQTEKIILTVESWFLAPFLDYLITKVPYEKEIKIQKPMVWFDLKPSKTYSIDCTENINDFF